MTKDSLLRVILFIACLGLVHCASTPEEEAKDGKAALQHRLTKEWIHQARMIPLASYTVYYKGESETGTEMPLIGWAGTVSGEVLVLNPKSAVVCSKVRIDASGGVEILSKDYMEEKEPPNDWEHLIPR